MPRDAASQESLCDLGFGGGRSNTVTNRVVHSVVLSFASRSKGHELPSPIIWAGSCCHTKRGNAFFSLLALQCYLLAFLETKSDA